ncbi:OLC1v1005420C2 [Oldenlandia corymbosa var. corymbosa]|uniref:Flavin-containing monooxygenase n=1 Tax=Oldenlandia corymbosa var. corymbosa TaxID=529605 RepID=A0AAV1DEN7_OLDCO|nr:OLC1v1005420C2 [Oldenlandia corymbosa var. corymbosa]
MMKPLKIAVIGAGAAGLATAREFKKEGHVVVVYEKSDRVGGIWAYDPRVEEDPLGLDPNREIIHSSLYRSVRTTIPRELMGFLDYPFNVKDKNGVFQAFPGHEEVFQFLNNFARDFRLMELIRFSIQVVRVEQLENGKWVVEGKHERDGIIVNSEEWFDAVVVCNGHFTQPKLAKLPGIEKWPAKQIHSHNYRVPEPFRDQCVIVVGDGPSAQDISLEISTVAKEVHISSRAPGINVSKKMEKFDNLWQHPKIKYCYKNGEVEFEDETLTSADAIVHCTGYKYALPFLKTNGVVTIDDNRVGPLYKHMFPPQLAPTLSFVGIPNRANNFLMMQIQAEWVVCVLSGKAFLPSKEEMLEDVEEHYKQMESMGVPKHYTHQLPLNQVSNSSNPKD